MKKNILAVAAAVALTVVVWSVARVLGADLRVDPQNGQEPDRIALPFAAAVALVVSLLGWAVRAGLDRFVRRAAVVWTVLAGVVLVASFLPVLTVGASGGTRVALGAMHLAVAVALIARFGTAAAPARAGGRVTVTTGR
jgi:hypothetical protein